MADDPQTQITSILLDLDRREEAAAELLPLVYEHLHAIARYRMADERRNHTLQATALVHEAYLRLVGSAPIGWQSKGQFYGAAAEAMRRILIEHARKRSSQKRGGGRAALPLSVVDLAEEQDPQQILALEEALKQLEDEDSRSASIIKLRFFGGLGVEETAEALGMSPRTVRRDWTYARSRLYQLLQGPGD